MKLIRSFPLTVMSLALLLVACQASTAGSQEDAGSRVSGATLGVTTAIPSQELADEMGLEMRIRQQGRLVESVVAQSAAFEAGIRSGDVLLQLGYVTLYSQDDIDDFVSVHAPGQEVRALLVRAKSGQREELLLELGSGAARPADVIDWQYASLAQLPAALERARAEKKEVLVGLSGAETWWPSTRFEGGALSSILSDPAVVRATDGYVRVIIRRPHAYWFLDQTFADEGGVASATPAGCVTADGTVLPLPGLYVVDSEGASVATTTIRNVDEVLDMLDDPEALSASAPEPAPAASETVSIRVSGFTAAEGITWHGWPNRVKGALDGLPGVHEIEVDLADDRFDITFDPELVSVPDFLRTIRKLDYEPLLVDAPAESAVVAERIAPDSLPDDLRALFAQAKAQNKLLLVEFSGPGWVSCVRMDTVTYPHPDVKEELTRWLQRRADVAAERELATTFEVVAIPTAVLLDHDGRVLERIVGFVPPDDFLQRLSDARRGR
jgi:copper chaperone CopZ